MLCNYGHLISYFCQSELMIRSIKVRAKVTILVHLKILRTLKPLTYFALTTNFGFSQKTNLKVIWKEKGFFWRSHFSFWDLFLSGSGVLSIPSSQPLYVAKLRSIFLSFKTKLYLIKGVFRNMPAKVNVKWLAQTKFWVRKIIDLQGNKGELRGEFWG